MIEASRAAVLGGGGFLGAALCERLRATGLDVEAPSSRELDLRGPSAVKALEALLDPDTLFVFAAAVAPPRGATADGFADNVAMVGNVARALERSPVRSCVYLSTDGVYRWGPDPVTEDSAPEPIGYYPIAKYAGELVLQTVSRDRFPLLILRPVAVFGPGDTHDAYGPNRFVRSIVDGCEVRLFGNGEEVRDHIYVDDVARLTIALVEAGRTGVFNLATGEARTFASIVDELRELVPHELVVTSIPRAGPVTHRSYDIARLRAAVPEVRFTPFREALRRMLVEQAG